MSSPKQVSSAFSKRVRVDSSPSNATDENKLREIQSTLVRFKDLYKVLNRNTLSAKILAEVYAEDIHFEDSLHAVQGLPNMLAYFEGLYENVKGIEFEWHDESVSDSCAFVTWTMSYQHPGVNSGRTVNVEGASRLKIESGLVTDHRDYFDAGEMLYEHLPLLGFAIRKLKKRLA